MLTDVLKEASDEITALKARIAATEEEAETARRQLHDHLREEVTVHAKLAMLQAAAGAEHAVGPEGVAISVDTAAAGPPGDRSLGTPTGTDGVPSGASSGKAVNPEVAALRENYHNALSTNEALLADIQELQSQIAALEERVAGAGQSTKARSRSVTGGLPVTAADDTEKERLVFEVFENQRHFPLGGWSSQTLPTDPYEACFADDVAPATWGYRGTLAFLALSMLMA